SICLKPNAASSIICCVSHDLSRYKPALSRMKSSGGLRSINRNEEILIHDPPCSHCEFDLPHDALCPLNSTRDQGLCPRARLGIKEVFHTLTDCCAGILVPRL